MRFPTHNELMHFLANDCVGKEYDSCIDSPCLYASAHGCQHRNHPKFLPPMISIGRRVRIKTMQSMGRTGSVAQVETSTGMHWVQPDDRDEYVVGPFSGKELEPL